MSSPSFGWICHRHVAGAGWEVYIEWPDGAEWHVAFVDEVAQADRLRATFLAEIDAWNWAPGCDEPHRDPLVPLLVLASTWRTSRLRAFNEIWLSLGAAEYGSADEKPPNENTSAADCNEEDFGW